MNGPISELGVLTQDLVRLSEVLSDSHAAVRDAIQQAFIALNAAAKASSPRAGSSSPLHALDSSGIAVRPYVLTLSSSSMSSSVTKTALQGLHRALGILPPAQQADADLLTSVLEQSAQTCQLDESGASTMCQVLPAMVAWASAALGPAQPLTCAARIAVGMCAGFSSARVHSTASSCFIQCLSSLPATCDETHAALAYVLCGFAAALQAHEHPMWTHALPALYPVLHVVHAVVCASFLTEHAHELVARALHKQLLPAVTDVARASMEWPVLTLALRTAVQGLAFQQHDSSAAIVMLLTQGLEDIAQHISSQAPTHPAFSKASPQLPGSDIALSRAAATRSRFGAVGARILNAAHRRLAGAASRGSRACSSGDASAKSVTGSSTPAVHAGAAALPSASQDAASSSPEESSISVPLWRAALVVEAAAAAARAYPGMFTAQQSVLGAVHQQAFSTALADVLWRTLLTVPLASIRRASRSLTPLAGVAEARCSRAVSALQDNDHVAVCMQHGFQYGRMSLQAAASVPDELLASPHVMDAAFGVPPEAALTVGLLPRLVDQYDAELGSPSESGVALHPAAYLTSMGVPMDTAGSLASSASRVSTSQDSVHASATPMSQPAPGMPRPASHGSGLYGLRSKVRGMVSAAAAAAVGIGGRSRSGSGAKHPKGTYRLMKRARTDAGPFSLAHVHALAQAGITALVSTCNAGPGLLAEPASRAVSPTCVYPLLAAVSASALLSFSESSAAAALDQLCVLATVSASFVDQQCVGSIVAVLCTLAGPLHMEWSAAWLAKYQLFCSVGPAKWSLAEALPDNAPQLSTRSLCALNALRHAVRSVQGALPDGWELLVSLWRSLCGSSMEPSLCMRAAHHEDIDMSLSEVRQRLHCCWERPGEADAGAWPWPELSAESTFAQLQATGHAWTAFCTDLPGSALQRLSACLSDAVQLAGEEAGTELAQSGSTSRISPPSRPPGALGTNLFSHLQPASVGPTSVPALPTKPPAAHRRTASAHHYVPCELDLLLHLLACNAWRVSDMCDTAVPALQAAMSGPVLTATAPALTVAVMLQHMQQTRASWGASPLPLALLALWRHGSAALRSLCMHCVQVAAGLRAGAAAPASLLWAAQVGLLAAACTLREPTAAVQHLPAMLAAVDADPQCVSAVSDACRVLAGWTDALPGLLCTADSLQGQSGIVAEVQALLQLCTEESADLPDVRQAHEVHSVLLVALAWLGRQQVHSNVALSAVNSAWSILDGHLRSGQRSLWYLGVVLLQQTILCDAPSDSAVRAESALASIREVRASRGAALVAADVRNSAVQTLFGIASASASELPSSYVQHMVSRILLPLTFELTLRAHLYMAVDAGEAQLPAVADALLKHSSSAPVLGHSDGAAVLGRVHHSHDATSKLWIDVRVAALQGLTRVVLEVWQRVHAEHWFMDVWSGLLALIERACTGTVNVTSAASPSVQLCAIGTDQLGARQLEPATVAIPAIGCLVELAAVAAVPAGPGTCGAGDKYAVGMRVVNGALQTAVVAVPARAPGVSPGLNHDVRNEMWQDVHAVLHAVCHSYGAVTDESERTVTALLEALQHVLLCACLAMQPGANAGSSAEIPAHALALTPRLSQLLVLQRDVLILTRRRKWAELNSAGNAVDIDELRAPSATVAGHVERTYVKVLDKLMTDLSKAARAWSAAKVSVGSSVPADLGDDGQGDELCLLSGELQVLASMPAEAQAARWDAVAVSLCIAQLWVLVYIIDLLAWDELPQVPAVSMPAVTQPSPSASNVVPPDATGSVAGTPGSLPPPGSPAPEPAAVPGVLVLPTTSMQVMAARLYERGFREAYAIPPVVLKAATPLVLARLGHAAHALQSSAKLAMEAIGGDDTSPSPSSLAYLPSPSASRPGVQDDVLALGVLGAHVWGVAYVAGSQESGRIVSSDSQVRQLALKTREVGEALDMMAQDLVALRDSVPASTLAFARCVLPVLTFPPLLARLHRDASFSSLVSPSGSDTAMFSPSVWDADHGHVPTLEQPAPSATIARSMADRTPGSASLSGLADSSAHIQPPLPAASSAAAASARTPSLRAAAAHRGLSQHKLWVLPGMDVHGLSVVSITPGTLSPGAG